MSTQEADRVASAQQTLDILYEMSQLLNTGLDRETLTICVRMIESGVNPEALAAVIQELRRENIALNAHKAQTQNSGGTLSNRSASRAGSR